MPPRISDLHAKFLSFAQGMPAIAIAWEQVQRDVAQLQADLSGTNPGAPSVFMADIPMPVYRLAYSGFVQRLLVQPAANGAELTVDMIANVHPVGQPASVIRSYRILTKAPAALTLELDTNSNEAYWRQQGSAPVDITGTWGPNADAILDTTTIPAPQRPNYLDEVERQVIWLTSGSFVRLVADALPRYNLAEIVPWLRLQPPLRVDFSTAHIVITAARGSMEVGDCTPMTIPIEPDPAFPYGEHIPAPTLVARKVDVAVYAPKTRLVQFIAEDLQPAVLATDSGGGFIKWYVGGAFGLKRLEVGIATGQGVVGVLSAAATVEYLGNARAWIDGPCGTKLSLANGTIIGDGNFAADMIGELRDTVVELNLKVTRCELDPDIEPGTILFWPLTVVIAWILEVVAKSQAKKLEGKVTHIARWDTLVIPRRIVDGLQPNEKLRPYTEGLERVAAYVGVTRQAEGRKPPSRKPPRSAPRKQK